MFFDERPMKDKQVDAEEIWSAIRYLDPDERDTGSGDRATIAALFALVIMVCAMWGLLWLKVRQP